MPDCQQRLQKSEESGRDHFAAQLNALAGDIGWITQHYLRALARLDYIYVYRVSLEIGIILEDGKKKAARVIRLSVFVFALRVDGARVISFAIGLSRQKKVR